MPACPTTSGRHSRHGLRAAKELGRLELQLAGRHNLANALAAVAVGMELGVPFGQIAPALAGFAGVGRRYEDHGEHGGVHVVDDYGHHPTEVTATLHVARTSGRRVTALFQPHRYSRTQHFCDRSPRPWRWRIVVGLLPIYAASEDPIAGVDSGMTSMRSPARAWKRRPRGWTQKTWQPGLDAYVRGRRLAADHGGRGPVAAGSRILSTPGGEGRRTVGRHGIPGTRNVHTPGGMARKRGRPPRKRPGLPTLAISFVASPVPSTVWSGCSTSPTFDWPKWRRALSIHRPVPLSKRGCRDGGSQDEYRTLDAAALIDELEGMTWIRRANLRHLRDPAGHGLEWRRSCFCRTPMDDRPRHG